MKSFDNRALADNSDREYILGLKDLGTHACYMIYGYLDPGEEGRPVKPGNGHEEIIVAVKGDLEVTGGINGILKEGFAFHLADDTECFFKNNGSERAVYIASGGHSGSGH